MNYQPIYCTIDRFENGKAILEFDDHEFLTVAQRFLPKNTREGDLLRVEFLTDDLATKRQKNLAKAILEELLNGGA